jgi:hypothetical protein
MSFPLYDINYCVILNTLQAGNSGEGRGVLNFPIYSTEVSWYQINFISMRELRFSPYRELAFLECAVCHWFCGSQRFDGYFCLHTAGSRKLRASFTFTFKTLSKLRPPSTQRHGVIFQKTWILWFYVLSHTKFNIKVTRQTASAFKNVKYQRRNIIAIYFSEKCN